MLEERRSARGYLIVNLNCTVCLFVCLEKENRDGDIYSELDSTVHDVEFNSYVCFSNATRRSSVTYN